MSCDGHDGPTYSLSRLYWDALLLQWLPDMYCLLFILLVRLFRLLGLPIVLCPLPFPGVVQPLEQGWSHPCSLVCLWILCSMQLQICS